jgi:DNA segregation ATPase FtsK/SpoIIIE, S-DNA-T family
MSTVLFARRARRPKPAVPGDEIQIQEPPAVPEDQGGGISSVLMYAPMGLGSIAMVLMFVRPGSGLMSYIGGGMMLVSVIGMLVVQMVRNSVTHKQKLHGHRRDYIRYLAQLRGRVRKALTAQQRAARWVHPDPRALWSMALGYRLWERRPAQDDFGEVRIGVGTQRSAMKLLPPDTKPIEDLEPLAAHALRRFLKAYSTLPDAPIAVYLRGFGQIQLTGDEDAVLGLVRAMLGQLATAHAPGDVRIALCADDERVARWDWLKWLPHNQDAENRDAAGPRRLVADSIGGAEALLGGTAFTGRPRFEADTPVTASEPYVVLIVDGAAVPADHRAADEGYRNAVVIDVGGSLPWQPRPGVLFLEVTPEQASTVSFDRLGRPGAKHAQRAGRGGAGQDHGPLPGRRGLRGRGADGLRLRPRRAARPRRRRALRTGALPQGADDRQAAAAGAHRDRGQRHPARTRHQGGRRGRHGPARAVRRRDRLAPWCWRWPPRTPPRSSTSSWSTSRAARRSSVSTSSRTPRR